MPRNTSTNADILQARTELGARLRDLRRAAGMTGQRLAEVHSWAPSKVSKIENGRQTPTDDEIKAWCRAVGAQDQVEALLTELHTLETRHQEWQRMMRGGVAAVQDAAGREEAKTRLFRGFQSTLVPGVFQTPEYARGIFERVGRVWTQGEGIAEAVTARMRRQELLYDPARKFRVVITEAVLHYGVCPPAALLGQIDRLVSLSMLPNISLGVIPVERSYTLLPTHGFWIHDDNLVIVETVSAELHLAQPQEVDLYAKTFESMALDADYDQKARAILNRAGQQIAERVTEQA